MTSVASSAAGASLRAKYRQLYRELIKQHGKIYNMKSQDQIKKEKALERYRQMQLLHKSTDDSTAKSLLRAKLYQKEAENSLKKKHLKLTIGEIRSLNLRENIENADVLSITSVFLKSQRQYQELLERYNPGMTMSQQEKVKKTARRVGLDVPEY